MKGFATQNPPCKALSPESVRDAAGQSERFFRTLRKFDLFFDASILFAALALAVRMEWQAPRFWQVGELSKVPLWKLLAAFGSFALVHLWISRHHYESPLKKRSLLQEQELNLQDCAISALFLLGVLYLTGAEALSRAFVFLFLVLVTFGLSIRRLLYRTLPTKPTGSRNVLIIGADPFALAIREQLRNNPELGFVFKGFVELSNSDPKSIEDPGEVIGTIDKLAEHVCKYAVTEVFLTASCSRKMTAKLVNQAHDLGINSRMILDHLRFDVLQKKKRNS